MVKGTTLTAMLFMAGTVIAGITGGYTLRPIVDYQLTGPNSISMFLGENITAEFYFNSDNSGQTDVTLNVAVAAINATVCRDKDGIFASSAWNLMLVKSKTGFGLTFYLMPNQRASSFVVSISSVTIYVGPSSTISDVISSAIVQFREFHPVNRQFLRWVRNPELMPLVFELK